MSQAPIARPSTHPVTVELGPTEVKRWSPLLNWLLAIPHLLVLMGLRIVGYFVSIISFFSILFTKNIPDGLFGFAVMCQRYEWRVQSYVFFLRSDYPPFEFVSDSQDPGTDPARISIEKPVEYRRFMPLIKWLLLFPHFLVLALLGIALYAILIIGFFAVLITGRWPAGLQGFLVGYMRWSIRAGAYVLLVDEYPPFSLE